MTEQTPFTLKTLETDADDTQTISQYMREALQNAAVATLTLLAVAGIITQVGAFFAAGGVEETITDALARLAVVLIPYIAYTSATSVARRHVGSSNTVRAVGLALAASLVIFVVVSVGHYIFDYGPFSPQPSLQMTLSQTDDGIRVDAIELGGAADEAGMQVGDLITAIRRDEVDLAELNQKVGQSLEDDPLRLRFLRDGEELQETVRVAIVASKDVSSLIPGLIIAMVFTVIIVFMPGKWAPYLGLIMLLFPLLIGYLWVIIATFSYRTEGIFPLDSNDNIGGFTLKNWESIFKGNIAGLEFEILPILLTSLGIAVVMTITILLVSSMSGYALSRMNFPGRRFFLSFTLILHGFPAVTLLIPIFFVLLNLGKIPIVGDLVGFNTVGGIALVMVAFQLPLGIWLMKGFFDNIPWDMERSAMIDGASRWRTYWEILLPQIRPGLLALGIFAFISGWNAYIIPATYSIGAGVNNLPVFLNELIDETAPVDWNQVAAVGMFQLIPVFVFFIFAQEYLLNIYAGGTKGSS